MKRYSSVVDGPTKMDKGESVPLIKVGNATFGDSYGK